MNASSQSSLPRAFMIVGAGGMLGSALQLVLTERGAPFLALTENDLDITDETLVFDEVADFCYRYCGGGASARHRAVVVNAAAYTNVERAEDEPDRAFAVNALAPQTLAAACVDQGCRFVHVSTDFVFDGCKQGAYTETDQPNPLSIYGESKLEGEWKVAERLPESLIIRTAWVFGPNGVNFPVKVLATARERGSVTIVTDECGSPTYTVDLANALVDLESRGAVGTFHLAGSGSCTRFELAEEVLRLAGLAEVQVEPALSAAFPTKAQRPMNSVLDCGKAESLGVTMPHWRDGLARFVAGLGRR